ncbi:MAG: MtaA/CmuA family methyltransferase [Candidatus Methanomethylophilaceae archaeon]|nr:MtaA/CmuA family methyltransferase [Candidatus Methanomethylophilaceae archaeon]MBR7124004.1 MtaA/CmuA family methyltransferase [Candidatus Methanomethylophilaceae archaeon]
MTPRERVLAAMKQEKLDRPPVAVFTQSATVGEMENCGAAWPEAHSDAKLMAKLGAAQATYFGFEAVRSSFCLTAEAERLGCNVDPGKINSTPMIKKHPFKFDAMEDVYDEPNLLDPEEFLKGGRPAVILEATKLLKEQYGNEYAVIGGNTGPFTLAGHMVSTENLVFGIMMNPEMVAKWIDAVNPIVKAYTQALADAGADIIQMSEPSSSTDLLSPDMFTEYSGRYVKESLASVKGADSVLHICGDTSEIIPLMADTGVTGISVEEKVDSAEAVRIAAGRVACVGNVGVVNPLLQGTPEDCAAAAKRIAEAGFNVISPGCGLSALIKDENLFALVKAIKG